MDQVYRFVAVTVGFWSSDAHANVEATRITGMLFTHDKKMDITILRVDVEEHG